MSREAALRPVLVWNPDGFEVHVAGRPPKRAETLAALVPELQGHRTVVVALSRRLAFLKTTAVPEASKADVVKLLSFQLGQMFPLPANEAAMDLMLTDERDPEGRVALVGAVRAEVVRDIHTQLKSHNLGAAAIVPLALGSMRLAQQQGMREAVLTDDTGTGLAIDVVRGGVLRLSREIPYPESVPDEIERTLAIAKAPADTPTLSGVAAAQLGSGEFGLDLELPEVVARREDNERKTRQRVATLLWVAVVLLGAVLYSQRLDAEEVASKGEARWKKRIARLQEDAKMAKGSADKLGATAKALDLAFEPKQSLADVATIMSSMVPNGVWLTGINFERGKLATIRGTAMDGDKVAAYLANLSAQRRFRDVKLIFANNGLIEDTNVVNFSIQTHIVGNFPVVEDARGGRR